MMYTLKPTVKQQPLEEIAAATSADPTLQIVKKYLDTGWPESHATVPEEARPYFSCRSALSCHAGCVLRGRAIAIPDSMQQGILQRLHAAHQGVQKMMLAARDRVYWPRMQQGIKKHVENCTECQAVRNSNPRQAVQHPHPTPAVPWDTVGMDLFHFSGESFLIMVDYMSKYPMVNRVQNNSAESLTVASEKMFSFSGYPRTIMCDMDSNFTSESFQSYCKGRGIAVKHSAAQHHQSNGLAERHIQTVKNLLRKCVNLPESEKKIAFHKDCFNSEPPLSAARYQALLNCVVSIHVP